MPENLTSDFEKLYAANVTANSLTPPTPTADEPRGPGVFHALIPNQAASIRFSHAALLFWGEGADDSVAGAILVLWHKLGSLWVPEIQSHRRIVLSTTLGVSGQTVNQNERLADRIMCSSINNPAFTAGSEAGPEYHDPECPRREQGSNTPLVLRIPLNGAKLEVRLAVSTCTSINVAAAGY